MQARINKLEEERISLQDQLKQAKEVSVVVYVDLSRAENLLKRLLAASESSMKRWERVFFVVASDSRAN